MTKMATAFRWELLLWLGMICAKTSAFTIVKQIPSTILEKNLYSARRMVVRVNMKQGNDYLSNLSSASSSGGGGDGNTDPTKPPAPASPMPASSSTTATTASNKSQLPEIPGDYDWDTKYQGESGWVSEPGQIPGKRVIPPEELMKQAQALAALENEWRKEFDISKEEDTRKVGFVPQAELLNGRVAMFFIVTGLLTEYWTGISLPGQVEELLRVLGLIGFE